ncbi:MAG: type IX secretion system sortase PorU [Bacteroidales bacterium]|nr:type IX secretion system sortase PorU [Bacteroidales bacterium]
MKCVAIRKKVLIILLATGFSFFKYYTYGQEGVYRLKWTGNISETHEYQGKRITEQFLHFEGAEYDANGVPRYLDVIGLNGKPERLYYIKDLRYESVPDSLLNEVQLPEVLPSDVPAIHSFGSKGEYYSLDINIPAIRINPLTGKVERLASFSIGSKKTEETEGKTTKAAMSYDSSLLGSGYWYKFKVKESGVYRLSYADLVEMGLSNPGNVRLFGHGGRQLSYWNSDPRPVDMKEIPVYMNKGSDGTFGEGDYILFYAEGPLTWDYDASDDFFRQKIHGYSQAIFYFATSSHGEGARIQQTDYSALNSTVEVNEYDEYVYYEHEVYNLIGSGRVWYSSRIDLNDFDTTFTFNNLSAGDTFMLEAKVAGRSAGSRRVYLWVDGVQKQSELFPTVYLTPSYSKYAQDLYFKDKLVAGSSQINVGVSYDKIDQTDEAYIDYITLNGRSELKVAGNQTYFRDINSVGEGNIARFSLQNASSSIKIWDITNINQVHSLKGELSGSALNFKAPADTLRQYLAVNINGDFPKPLISRDERGVGEVPNQNLRSSAPANYIIVAPPVFARQAERLADFHRYEGGLTVSVVDPQEIYNEFSSGTPDISAIRDFFRHQYKKGDSDFRLNYVLLFGDGSFNNHFYKEGNTNYVLTYQSGESLIGTRSYTSDDFFGMLDDNEGEVAGLMDIGVGRLPVAAVDGSDSEAKGVVNKILGYYSSDHKDWRRRLCVVGDDQYDPGGASGEIYHMKHANELADQVLSAYPGFDVKKVLLDAYPQVSSATGDSYPDVNKELRDLFDRGLLVFCYFGHGSENQITGEIILQKSDMQTMKNKSVLPLFVTATCQFSRYDHVAIEEDNDYKIEALTSAGESGILNPDGGAVALLSTSRVVSSTENFILASNTFSHLFACDEEGNPCTLGEAIMKAKNEMSTGSINKLNFTLLGDPAMVLNYPRYMVCTDSINGVPVAEATDTLKAFSEVSISGYVAYSDSTIMDDFNGYVYPQIYDKAVQIKTFGNDEQPSYTYWDQKNLLYKGKASVSNGRFRFTFVVPKDIAYNVDMGKISYYAENGVIDAMGEYTEVYVGGTDNQASPDDLGPEIALYINDNRFEDGGMTNESPRIYAELFDDNGINTTGAGIGHDIVAVLDGEYADPFILNDHYEALADDYTQGIVSYPLSGLGEGDHYVILKVWDVYNNSSEASVGFVVMTDGGLVLDKAYNYPNPAADFTQFIYTHNSAEMEHEIVLKIYDPMGRLIARKEYTHYETGYVSEPIQWSFGSAIGPGIYPYQLEVTTPLGTSVINNRLIIIR